MPAAGQALEALYFPTDVSPERLFRAIGKLRKDAREEIDRLLRFLDETENHMELEDDGDLEEVGDDEPSLGTFDRIMDQTKSSRQNVYRSGWMDAPPPIDTEQDGADAEPALGSLDQHDNQEQWAAGDRRDREQDGGEPGIGDLDGLQEQIARKTGSAGDGLMSDTPADLAHEIFDLASLLGTILAGPDADSAIDGMHRVALEIRERAERGRAWARRLLARRLC
jgi:hypothetical protein